MISRRDTLALTALSPLGLTIPDTSGATSAAQPATTLTEFLRMPQHFTKESWLDHWLHIRHPLLLQLEGVTAATFNLTLEERSPDARYDGVVQLTFQTKSHFESAVTGARSSEFDAALVADSRHFQQAEPFSMLTRSVSIREPVGEVSKMAKRIGLVGRRPELGRSEFQRDWKMLHAPDVLGQYGLEGYRLQMMERAISPSIPWDGYAELWWTDWAALEEAQRRGSNGYAKRAGFFHDHMLLYLTEFGAA